MASTLLILAVAASAMALTWSLLLKSHEHEHFTIKDWEKKKWDIHIDIFRSLLNRREEQYLARSLSREQFLLFQRRRVGLALRLTSLATQNAEMLMKLGELARSEEDPLLVREANQLVADATQFRLSLLLAKCCLLIRWVFPNCSFSLPAVETRYSRMLNSVVRIQQHSWQL